MKKIFSVIMILLLMAFIYGTPFATIKAGSHETVSLAAGEVLTVTAPPGATGTVVRLSRTPGGGNSQSTTVINGADLTFGPYAQTERFDVRVDVSTVEISMAAPTPYTTSIADGDTSHSPDANAVYDALALKAPVADPVFTGTANAPILTSANATLTTADINGGTLDNVIIGSNTAAAGTFTTVTATGEIRGLTGVERGNQGLEMTTAMVANTVWNNTGQGIHDVEHRLPAAANGLSFRVVITENSANYIRFLAAENAAVIAFNGTSGKTYVGMNTPTIGATLDMISLQVAGTGLLVTPALAIGGTNTAVSSGSFTFDIAGTGYAKAAVIAGTAPGNDVIPANVVGAVAFDIGADGTIDVIEATNNATGYANVTLAKAGCAAAEAAHLRLGYVTASMAGDTFTFGTTPLNAANSTVTYTTTAPYTRPYNWIATGILGDWLTD